MRTPTGSVTRGLLGAVELRDPDDGVILPHENTMAGPVSDRLELMTATDADLEPIYLVYDGGGAASRAVASVAEGAEIARAATGDGIVHTLWSLTDPALLADIAADLSGRTALIADGHHRYATYRQRQARNGGEPGPWDRGLTFLVDTSEYGPEVHPIHRVVAVGFDDALRRLAEVARVDEKDSVAEAEAERDRLPGFAVVLAGGQDRVVVVSELDPEVVAEALGDETASPVAALDVSVVHRVVVEGIFDLDDDETTVRYAHSVEEALGLAADVEGVAVLLAATPVGAVAEVAAAGLRMPRKSTLFTPKPASGLVLRRLSDQSG